VLESTHESGRNTAAEPVWGKSNSHISDITRTLRVSETNATLSSF